MARQIIVLALIFVALIGMTMAEEAPSASPKSSPSPKSSASPRSSPAPSTESESPLSSPPSPSEEESDISAPPAPASDPIELYAPEPEPLDSLGPDADAAIDAESSASTLQLSLAMATIVFAGYFAF